MTTKTPIAVEDIRPGDKVRRENEWSDGATEWRVGATWTAPRFDTGQYFLLDRPKKLVYAKGTTLYLKGDGSRYSFKLGHDHFEGDVWVYTLLDTRYRADYYTDEKPRTLKWAKGTTLWLTRRYFPWSEGEEITLREDWYDDATRCGVNDPECKFYVVDLDAVTDVEPEPHPVGAIRWVTEDTKSPYDYHFKRGDRVEVRERMSDGDCDLLVRPYGQSKKYIQSKFLSATKVEPWPTLVAVPLPAIKELHDAQERAFDARTDSKKNDIRLWAIDDFLTTRAVKTALDIHAE